MPEDLQLFKKETPKQVFSCEICENFKNTYFEEQQRTSASRVIISIRVFAKHSLKDRFFGNLTDLECMKQMQSPESVL